ncbi:hypothetical protein AAFN88_16085 [Pelagibius sp. CAU 1746]|uniref:hypothetical protein n=1 Tax=Pelagibius sp. CAU 1746 TaxID=3140370 RepID=UPI00325A754D
MIKWAVAATLVLASALLAPGSGRAWQNQTGDALLLLDAAPLDAGALSREAARGAGLEMQPVPGPVNDFGVILWDEMKQGRPPAPQPRVMSGGQGMNSVSAKSR